MAITATVTVATPATTGSFSVPKTGWYWIGANGNFNSQTFDISNDELDDVTGGSDVPLTDWDDVAAAQIKATMLKEGSYTITFSAAPTSVTIIVDADQT